MFKVCVEEYLTFDTGMRKVVLTVYDVRNVDGEPWFLVFSNGKWRYIPSRYTKPYVEPYMNIDR